ncbi:MAG: ubiquinol-cytochrome c reductase iron-sulfur subunit [Acidobacteriota bacterium]
MPDRDPDRSAGSDPMGRRSFLSLSSSLAMLAGLAGGYGAFALIAARFLYPARPRARRWMFVAVANELRPDATLVYELPGGARVNVTRQGSSGGVEDFVALSSVCPHLGCHVHWEAANARYFCPCHNGVFDATGRATGGPPGEAGQSLSRYRLKIADGLLYIQAPLDRLAGGEHRAGTLDRVAGIQGPGHDPRRAGRKAVCAERCGAKDRA